MRSTEFSIAILALVALAGCAKQELDSKISKGNSPVFTASIAEFEGEKTTLDGLDVLWVKDDQITICDNEGHKAVYKAVSAGATTQFEYVEGDELSAGTGVNYKAYYPAGLEGNVLPWQQIGSATGVSEACPMVAESSTTTLHFNNIAGLIRFNLTTTLGSTSLKKIILSCPDKGVSGKYSIQNGKAVLTGIEPLEFNLRGAIALGTGAKSFYVAVPEGDYNKMSLRFETNGGAVQELAAKNVISVEKGKVTTVSLPLNKLFCDLSAAETANCYIAPRAGVYKLRTVKGNGNISVGTATSAKVVWETLNKDKTVNKGDIIKTISLDGDYIVFECSENVGNAVIAACDDSGKILWSWHIWRTNSIAEQTYATGAVFLDRNLGATSTTKGGGSIGLVYQWGRKDPFVCGYGTGKMTTCPDDAASLVESSEHTSEFATANPATFITGTTNNDWLSTKDDGRWAATKTVNDPCPPGYRVPALADWADLSSCTWVGGTSTNGMYYKDAKISDESCWYPAGGERQVTNGVVQNQNTRTFYWAYNPSGNNANAIRAQSGSISKTALARGYGMAVRCVKISSGTPASDKKLVYVSGGKVVKADASGTEEWEYDAKTSLGDKFNDMDEAKPVNNLKSVLVTSCAGGVAIVDVDSKTASFKAETVGMPHSAELLPDGKVVVACSANNNTDLTTGGKLRVFNSDGSQNSEIACESAHNVVWDSYKEILWATSADKLNSYTYSNGNLSLKASYDFPNVLPHDLFPVYGSENELWISGATYIYKFNTDSHKFTPVKPWANAKSVNSGAEGYQTIIADHTNSLKDIDGKVLFSITEDQTIYKARWWQNNEFSYGDHTEYTDLSAAGTANCYIASSINTAYKFKATKGCSAELIEGITAVKVISSVLPQATAPEFHFVADVKYKDGYVCFSTGSKQGNSVIAAYGSNGKILWSWHIWRANYTATDVTLGTGKKMMDRNLGSFGNGKKTANSIGLIYEWGRKDPLPGNASCNQNSVSKPLAEESTDAIDGPVTVQTSIENPLRFIKHASSGSWCSENVANASWDGASKSIYDPCPAGYRVAEKSVWGASIVASEFEWDANNYGSSWTNASVNVWYQTTGQYAPTTGSMNSGSSLVAIWTRNLSGSTPVRFQHTSNAAAKTGGAASTYACAVRCQKEQ